MNLNVDSLTYNYAVCDFVVLAYIYRTVINVRSQRACGPHSAKIQARGNFQKMFDSYFSTNYMPPSYVTNNYMNFDIRKFYSKKFD